MSKVVDTRVVEMEFDNSNFEKNVKTSLSTIEKLKSSLDFEGAAKATKNLSKELQNVDVETLQNGIDQISNRFSTLGIIGMTIIQNLTNSALNSFKKVLGAISSGGITRAMNIEQAKFQLEGLGVAWADIVGDINYGVEGTAYGLDSAAKAASQLTASGIQLGKEMQTSLRGISGVAAMTNSSYDSIAQIFTTIAGNGRIMGMQLTQLSSYGLNVAATLGEYLGKSEAEIRDMVSKGQISFRTFADAMDSAFGEHAKDANKTFTGAMSNVKAALSRIGADFVTPFINSENRANNLVGTLNQLRTIIGAIHTSMKPFLKDFEQGVYVVLGGVNKRLEAFGAYLNNPVIQGVLKNFDTAFENALLGLSDILQAIKKAFTDTFGAPSLGLLLRFSRKVVELSKTFRLSYETSENLRSAFGGLFSLIKAIIGVVAKVSSLVSPLLKITQSLGRVLIDIAGAIGRVMTAVLNFIDATQILDGVVYLLNLLADAISFVADKVSWWLVRNDGIVKFIEKIFKTLSKLASQFANFIKTSDVLINIVKGIGYVFYLAAMQIKKWFDQFIQLPFVQNIITKVSDAFNNFGNTVNEIFADAPEKFQGFLDEVSEFSKELTLENISKAIKLFYDDIIKYYADKIIKKVKEFFDGIDLSPVADLFYSASEKIGDGFDIIKGGMDSVLKFLKDNSWNIVIIALSIVLVKVIKWLTPLANGINTVATALANGISTVATTINMLGKAMSVKILAGSFQTFAIGIAILTGSLIALSLIPPKKLAKAGIVLTGLLGIIIGFSIAWKSLIGTMKPDQIIKTSALIVAMSGSIILLVIALRKLDKVENLWTNILALGVIILELVGAVKLMGMITTRDLTRVSIFIAIAGSLTVMVFALKSLSKLNPDQIVTGLITMGIMVIYLKLLINSAASVSAKSLLSLLAVSGSIYLIVKAFERLAGMPFEAIIRGIIYSSLMLIEIVIFMKILNGVKIQINPGAALAIVAMGAAIALMAYAIKNIAGIKLEDLAKATAVMGMLSYFLSMLMKSVSAIGFGKHGLQVGAEIIMVAVAIGILTACVIALCMISDKGPQVLLATVVIDSMLYMLSLVMKASKGIKIAPKQLFGFALIIAILVASLAILAMLPDPVNLIAAAASLSVVMITLAGVFRIIQKTGKVYKGTMPQILAMAAAVAILGAVLAGMCLLIDDGLKAIEVAAALVLVMVGFAWAFASIKAAGKIAKGSLKGISQLMIVVAMVGAVLTIMCLLIDDGLKAIEVAGAMLIFATALVPMCIAFGTAGQLGTIALKGIGIIAAVVAAVTVMLYGLGALYSELPQAEKWMDGAIAFAGKVGQFIGSLFGGIEVGLVSQISIVTEQLSAMVDQLQPFIDFVRGIDDSVKTGASNLFEVIAMMSGAGLTTGWNNFFSIGSNPLATLGEQLSEFIDPFIDFANKVKRINNINDVTKICRIIPELAESLGQVKAKNISGGLNAMGTGLEEFGPKMVTFADSCTSISGNISDVYRTIPIVRALMEIANSNTGKSTGARSLGNFGDDLSDLYGGLEKVSEKAVNIKSEAIYPTLPIVKHLMEFANDNEGSSGTLSKFFSNDTTLTTFAEGIESLYGCLEKISKNCSNVNAEAIDATIPIVKKLIGLANSNKGSSGTISTFFGNDTSMETFGNNLKALYECLESVSGRCFSINVDYISATIPLVKDLIKMASGNEGSHGGFLKIFTDNSLETFGENLKSLYTSLEDISRNCSNIKPDSIDVTIPLVKRLLELKVDSNQKSGWFTDNTLSGFANNLSSLGNGLKSYSDSVTGLNIPAVTAGTVAIENIMNVIKEMGDFDYISTAVKFGSGLASLAQINIQEFLTAYTDAQAQAKEAAVSLVNSAADGLINSLKFYAAGKRGTEDYIKGFSSGQPKMLFTVVAMITVMNAALTIAATNAKVAGSAFSANYVSGINAGKPSALAAGRGLCSSASSGASGASLYSVGVFMAEGFANGILSKRYTVQIAGKTIAETALNAAKRALAEKSPSKKTYQFGEYFDQGFINGILALRNKVEYCAIDVAQSAINGMDNTISAIADALLTATDEDLNLQPVITPVLDTTGIASGARGLSSLFDSDQVYSISASMQEQAMDLKTLIELNREILSAIRTGGNVYLDSNVLVGSINRKLGGMI